MEVMAVTLSCLRPGAAGGPGPDLQGALAHLRQGMKIAFIIAHKKNNVVVLFGTLKVQSFMLTEVRDCDLLIVVTPSTFLKRKDMLKEKSS